MTLSGFLARLVSILQETGVPYMLTGSLAAAYYALPRATKDVDLVVDASPAQLEAVVDRLLEAGFYVSREAARRAHQTRGQFNAIDPERGWKVDLIVRKERPFSVAEFERRRAAELLGLELSITSLEDLILAKLEWSTLGESDLQRRDVVQLLEAGGDSVDRAYVEEWVGKLGLGEPWDAVDPLGSSGEKDSTSI